MRWDCDSEVDQMVYEIKKRLNAHIEMLYIQTISKLSPSIKKDRLKKLDNKLIETFLKKRGYTSNYILGETVMVKGFVCVFVQNSYVEIWHDKTGNSESIFINESLLTGLPITLNYMERI